MMLHRLKKSVQTKVQAQRGQVSSELFLVIAVIVVSVASVAYTYAPTFRDGAEQLGLDVSRLMTNHGSFENGYGLAADNASSQNHDDGDGGLANPLFDE